MSMTLLVVVFLLVLWFSLLTSQKDLKRWVGTLVKLIDMSLFLFFAILAVFLPLIDGQVFLPGTYLKFLTDLKNWYSSEFNDYSSRRSRTSS